MSGTTSSTAPAPQPESPLGQMLRGDPLARWLGRARITPWLFGILVFVYALIHAVALPAVYGHLHTHGKVLGALEDWPYLVIMAVMMPLLAAYYLWQPQAIESVYDGIAQRAGQNARAAALAIELVKPFGWPAWFWGAVAVGLVQVFSFVNDLRQITVPSWQTANSLMIASAQPLRFLAFYVIVFILVRQILTLGGLNRFFAGFTIEIAPLHPDRAGGLRILGDYVLSGAILLGVIGLNFGMTLLRGQANPELLTTEFYLELVYYLLAIPVIFFLPLWTVHTRMRVAKERLLAEVAEQFDQEYRGLLNGLRQNSLSATDVGRLEAVQKIYQIAAAAPVWPFDLGIMSKFGAAVFLPILAPVGVDLLAGWFNR